MRWKDQIFGELSCNLSATPPSEGNFSRLPISPLDLGEGLEAEAFAGREVCDDDLLGVLIGGLVDIEVTRLPLALFDAGLWPGGIGEAEPSRHIAHGSEKSVISV
jgi:hypothetical protein